MRAPLRIVLLIALAVVGTIAVLPAQAESSPGAFGSRLASLINQARAQHGLRSLSVTSGTSSVAATWTQHLASAGALSHNPNLGPQLESHGSRNWTTYGENVGEGPSSSADSLFKAYMNSPEHRDNILGSSYRYLGVGVVFSGSTAWNTLDFVDQYSSSSSTSTSSSTPTTSTSSHPVSAPRVTHHVAAATTPAAPRPATRTTHRAQLPAAHVPAKPAAAATPKAHPHRSHVVAPAKRAVPAAAPAVAIPAHRLAAVVPTPLHLPTPRPVLPVAIALALLTLLIGSFGRVVFVRSA